MVAQCANGQAFQPPRHCRRRSSAWARPRRRCSRTQRAVRRRDADVAAEGEQHLEGGFGVVHGAVGVFQGDSEARRDLAEGPRPLALLELAGPDQGVEPLDVPAHAGRRSPPTSPARASLVREERPVERGVVGGRDAPDERRGDLGRATVSKAGASLTSSSVILWTSLASLGIGPTRGSPASSCARPSRRPRAIAMPTSTTRSTEASRPVVSTSTRAMGSSVHARVGREALDEAAGDGAQQVRDARVVAPGGEATARPVPPSSRPVASVPVAHCEARSATRSPASSQSPRSTFESYSRPSMKRVGVPFTPRSSASLRSASSRAFVAGDCRSAWKRARSSPRAFAYSRGPASSRCVPVREELVVHLPELALRLRGDRGARGGLAVRVHRERHELVDEAHLGRSLLPELVELGGDPLAEGALEVGELDDRDRRAVGAAHTASPSTGIGLAEAGSKRCLYIASICSWAIPSRTAFAIACAAGKTRRGTRASRGRTGRRGPRRPCRATRARRRTARTRAARGA